MNIPQKFYIITISILLTIVIALLSLYPTSNFKHQDTMDSEIYERQSQNLHQMWKTLDQLYANKADNHDDLEHSLRLVGLNNLILGEILILTDQLSRPISSAKRQSLEENIRSLQKLSREINIQAETINKAINTRLKTASAEQDAAPNH